MNEYPKNNNVIIRERIKVYYLERNSHVTKTIEGITFNNHDR